MITKLIARSTIVAQISLICAVAAQTAALAANTYEAWYDCVVNIPGSATQTSKLHTYYDGKKLYGKAVNSLGDKSTSVDKSIDDPSTVAHLKRIGATSIGKKQVKGKMCEGFSYKDALLGRPSVDWIDETGHLYHQQIEKYTGADGTYVQTRTKYIINPKSSDLTRDPEVVSGH